MIAKHAEQLLMTYCSDAQALLGNRRTTQQTCNLAVSLQAKVVPFGSALSAG